jgi:hypothetical protein
MSNPIGVKRRVYFDTNAYWRCTSDRMKTIMAAERMRGIEGIAHPVVMIEMLNRLSDRSTPKAIKKFDSSRAALKKLLMHCETNNELRMLEVFHFRLARELFDATPPAEMKPVLHMAAVDCTSVSSVDQWGVGTRQEITRAVAFKAGILRHYDEWMGIIQPVKKEAQGFAKVVHIPSLISASHIRSVAKKVHRTPSEAQVAAMSRYVTRNYIIGTNHDTQTISNMHDGRRSEANDVWDAQLLYTLPIKRQKGELPILLVTEEPRIVRSGDQFSAFAVLSLEEYERYLKNPTRFRVRRCVVRLWRRLTSVMTPRQSASVRKK